MKQRWLWTTQVFVKRPHPRCRYNAVGLQRLSRELSQSTSQMQDQLNLTRHGCGRELSQQFDHAPTGVDPDPPAPAAPDRPSLAPSDPSLNLQTARLFRFLARDVAHRLSEAPDMAFWILSFWWMAGRTR
jgi:hypothetical protein